MSGVFGLFDPDGPDLGRMQRATAALAYRGSPLIVSDGPMSMGVVSRPDEATGVWESQDSMLVADARVDAVLRKSAPMAPEGHGGLAFLDACLGQVGPAGLDAVAADFVLARFERASKRLLLARDAIGSRPLFWARLGRRVAFASDPAFLWEVGVASDTLDAASITSYLNLGDTVDVRTAFRDVQRVAGGSWISFEADGRCSSEPWFRPEQVPVRRLDLREGAAEARRLVVDAVRDRYAGEPVGLCLTGGRDSGAVAVALALAGIRATCLTVSFPPGVAQSEAVPARELAEALGHAWVEIPVTPSPTRAEVEEVPRVSGTPFGIQPITASLALNKAVRELGIKVVMDGEGGEPLFSAAPVAILDLVRSGRLPTAYRGLRAFSTKWTFPPSVVAKAAGRAIAPSSLLLARERRRSRPPWVAAPRLVQRPTSAPRSARDHLIRLLREIGTWTNLETWERMCQLVGARAASPLFDIRVIRFCLSLPLDLRLPLPEPKPLLAAGLLGPWTRSRMKADQSGYFEALGASLLGSFPDLLQPGSRSDKLGLVNLGTGRDLGDTRWRANLAVLASLELWLREGEAHGSREVHV